MTLSDDLRRLEEIVRHLEEDDLDLDRSLALFEEGIRHLRQAREVLGAADARVQEVVAEAGDTIRMVDRDE